VIEKEIRALLPAWTVVAVALLASTFGVYPHYLGVPLYFISIAALGAFSMGHEYAYGTLGTLLAQPVPRWRIWTAKLGVLLPMILALTALAAWRYTPDRGDRVFGAALFWLPALAAVCIAPWLTMLARSALAGTVFTMGLVGGSMALGEWIGVSRYGYTRDVDAFRVAFMWWMLGILSFVSAIGSWWTFSRLEMTGDRVADVQLLTTQPGFAASGATVRRRHPLVALVRKELRLQQLALVVATIYTAACFGVVLSGASNNAAILFSVFTMFYVVSLPVVIGSLAAGEERQFGTHDAQLLLPMKASTQWAVKVGTALALALLLSAALPAVLTPLFPQRAISMQIGVTGRVLKPEVVVVIIAFASISLYVSTLVRSGLMALMYSIGAILGLGYFTIRVATWVSHRSYLIARTARGVAPRPVYLYSYSDGALFVGFTGFILLVLWLALGNYRFSDRNPLRVALHTAIVAGAIAACAMISGGLSAF